MRKLALAMAVAMAASRANALGLGDIELHSALNEPLNAEVHLLSEQPGELNNAVVRLATSEEFAQAGIERPGALSDIKFTIERHDDGTAVVKITSTQPIHEPFLDFIMQLNWQSGRLLREYTLLLDPPVFGEEKSAPVSAPVTAPSPEVAAPPAAEGVPPVAESVPTTAEGVPPPAVPQQAPQGIAAPGETPSANVVQKAGTNGGQNYGPTRRDETLWSIASGLRPDDSVSVYQMMMALLKANPHAFYGNNVNTLKAGYVLRVPEKSVVAAVNEQEAVREAARQYERWQQAKRRVGTPPESGTVLEPAVEAGQAAQPAAAKEQEKETARLHLVAPGEAAAKSAAAGGTQAELEKLRGELAIAMESSDTSKRESDEMRSRVAALEQQISSLQHLLTLKDEALGQMQKRAGAAVPQAAQKSGPALEVPAPAVVPKPAPVTKPAAPAKPAPKAAEASPGLLANPTLLGAAAGAGLLLASVAWLIVRRRRGRTEDSGPEADMGFNDALLAGTAEPAQEGHAAAPMEELQNDANLTQVAEEVAQLAEPNIHEAASDLDLLHTPEGDIDPIVEADVYLAYRRYQQAESLVQNALAKQPQRYELKAKLLEIYYVSKNDKAFQTVAQELYENLGNNSADPLWQRILPMGRELCPDYVLFRAPADSRAAQESLDTDIGGGGSVLAHQEEKMDFDLNLSADAPAAAAQIQESPAPLSQSSEFKDTPVKTGGKKESAAARGGQAPEAEAQKSWEIESAVSDFGNIDFGLEDSDVLGGTDVVGTKLDLARAYIDMGDKESASDILKEVAEEGNQQQKQEAKTLMEGIA